MTNGTSPAQQLAQGAQLQPILPPGQAARWNPFWSYRHQAAIRFASEEDLDTAIDLLWNDSDLQGLPHVHVGENTMIVPAEAVECLRQKACNFTLERVVAAGDLPPKTINKIGGQGSAV